MISASPRLGALLAGGAALLAFGLTGPAIADAGGANGQCGPGVTDPGPYCGPAVQPDREDGAPSLNGNGDGKAVGKPAAGSVGKADHKNPKGQLPDWKQDGNNGYECDTNNGIGKTNPAHTGCESFPDYPTVPSSGT